MTEGVAVKSVTSMHALFGSEVQWNFEAPLQPRECVKLAGLTGVCESDSRVLRTPL